MALAVEIFMIVSAVGEKVGIYVTGILTGTLLTQLFNAVQETRIAEIIIKKRFFWYIADPH
jgi:hypothetical protein